MKTKKELEKFLKGLTGLLDKYNLKLESECLIVNKVNENPIGWLDGSWCGDTIFISDYDETAKEWIAEIDTKEYLSQKPKEFNCPYCKDLIKELKEKEHCHLDPSETTDKIHQDKNPQIYGITFEEDEW